MIDIINTSGIKGVFLWDLNDYFNKGFYDVGNPMS